MMKTMMLQMLVTSNTNSASVVASSTCPTATKLSPCHPLVNVEEEVDDDELIRDEQVQGLMPPTVQFNQFTATSVCLILRCFVGSDPIPHCYIVTNKFRTVKTDNRSSDQVS